MSKVVPPEGDTFKGVFLPGGTEIGQNGWSIQRDEKVYGEDSTMFRPERWLQAKGEKLEAMEKTMNLNWGYGKYSCAGKSIAMMELYKVFFTVSFIRHCCNVALGAALGLWEVMLMCDCIATSEV